MTSLIVAACIFVSISIAAGLAGRAKRRRAKPGARLATKPPLTSDAQALHRRLVEALPQYIVLPRVGMNAFLTIPAGEPEGRSEPTGTQWRETADFLICDQCYLPVAAVELEDILERPRDRGHLRACLRAAGVPLLKWDSINLPDVRTIQESLAEIEALRLISQSREQAERPELAAASTAAHSRQEPKL